MANEYLKGLKLYKEGNYAEAIDLWTIASNDSDAEAKYALAREYISGENTERNFKLAVSLLEEAAKLGLGKAMETLFDVYERGAWGLKQNHDKALRYLNDYAQANSAAALKIAIALMQKYENDIDTAVRYAEVAAENGDMEAKLMVANYYSDKEYDNQKIVRYYREVANMGNETALFKLAEIYQKGLFGVEKDYGKYVEMIEELASEKPEDVDLQKTVIDIYENGLYGITKNLDHAFELVSDLAETDYNEEIYKFMLAEVFEFGKMGQKADPKKAVAIYSNLLSNYPDNQRYQLKMAEIFEEGKFKVAKDIAKATMIYSNLASRYPKNPVYQYKIGKMYYRNTDADSQKQALQAFEKAYENGSIKAGFYISTMLYEGGPRIPKNYGRAAKVAGEISGKIKDSLTLTIDEQKDYQRMKTIEILMYRDGGPNLPKNIRKAKELFVEYNANHQEKLKMKF